MRPRGTTALRRWTSGLSWSGVPTGSTPDRNSPEVHSGRQACTGVTAVHVSWAQDWQAAHDAQRSPSLAQPPPRCSRSAPPTLLIAPAEPDPEGLPGAGQLQSGSETAARTCLRAACGLPAAPGLPAAGASAALQALPVCLGPAAATAPLLGTCSVWRLPGVFGGAGGAVLALGGCRNVFGGQGLNGRPVLSFWPFLQCHPLSFAAS